MLLTRPKHRLHLLDASGTLPVPQEAVWETLERFAHDVAACEDAALQQQLALQAVRDSIDADAVYWHPGSGRTSGLVAGAHDLPDEWCASFTDRLLQKSPGLDGRLLHAVLPPGPRLAPVQPHSAALVRVSKSRSIWIVALSLSARRSFQPVDLQVMGLVRQILVNHRRRCELTGRMSETMAWLVQCLTASIDAHVPFAQGHSERVANVALEIGKRLHLPTPVLSDLYFAGLLHDVGISSVRQSVLLKPGALTDEEYAQVKAAPVIGDGVLAGIKQLAHLRRAVRHHRERFDGQGYPDGLAGDDIPLMARILGVADAFDAMLSPRPHRPALTEARVDAELAKGAGRRWDPCIIEHFMDCRNHLHTIRAGVTSSAAAAAVKDMVEAWNIDTSRNIPVQQARAALGRAPAGIEEAAPP